MEKAIVIKGSRYNKVAVRSWLKIPSTAPKKKAVELAFNLEYEKRYGGGGIYKNVEHHRFSTRRHPVHIKGAYLKGKK